MLLLSGGFHSHVHFLSCGRENFYRLARLLHYLLIIIIQHLLRQRVLVSRRGQLATLILLGINPLRARHHHHLVIKDHVMNHSIFLGILFDVAIVVLIAAAVNHLLVVVKDLGL